MTTPTSRVDLPATTQRLLVLGDPHGALAAVQAVVAAELRPDTTPLCVGDVVGKSTAARCSRLAEWMAAQDILTVQGNHEAWVSPTGALSVFEGEDPHLTPQAAAWARGLPAQLELFWPGRLGQPHTDPQAPPRRVAAVTHTLREPRWRDVTPNNARALVDHLGGPDLVLVGHTHRARVLQVPRRGPVTQHELDAATQDHLEVPLDPTHLHVVDAGSLAYPKGADGHPLPDTGTYAVVDLAAARIHLRRHPPKTRNPPP